MAASVRSTKRRYYNTPGVVNGNLARELGSHELERRLEHSGELAPDEYYVRRRESQSDILARRRAKVKAAGGIRTSEDAKRMIDAGADRIGASAGIAIVEAAVQRGEQ